MAGITPISKADIMATRPRLSGDGMDSATLSVSSSFSALNSVPTVAKSTSQRHRNLKSSTKAATIAKTQTPKFVPKEPVRGAVGPASVNKTRGSSLNYVDNSTGFQRTVQNKGPPSKRQLNFQYGQNTATSVLLPTTQSMPNIIDKPGIKPVNSVDMKINVDKSNLASNMRRDNLSHKPSVVDNKLHERSYNHAIANQTTNYCVQRYSTEPSLTENSVKFNQTSAPPKLTDMNKSSSKTRDVLVPMDTPKLPQSEATDTVIQMISPPDEERHIEGDLSTDENEVNTLKKELADLAKVNSDLKKLLVASVGDDLHWKMDALVRTKTQLATEIGGYTEKMRTDYEELDKLSIQADMWRSKFLATRVLIDKLSVEKEDLSARWELSQTALQQMLQERQQLHDNMVETHRYAKFVRDSLDPTHCRKLAPMIPNILELARTNLLLCEEVKDRLLGGAPVLAVALDAGVQNGLSPAEKLAYQVLMTEVKVAHSGSTAIVPGRLSAQVVRQFGRFHPQVRYEGFIFTCCRQCKGEVQVV